MINLIQELQNYPSIDIRSIAENVADSVRNSVILYNKAIESIRAQSEDIAIIELKKAIALNPDFHEAVNLLGLCYCYIKEYDKAADAFKRVIKAENNSILAQRYMDYYMETSEGSTQLVRTTKKKTKENVNSVAQDKEKPTASVLGKLKKNNKSELVGYIVIGLIAGILLTTVVNLIFPKDSYNAGKNKDTTQNATTIKDNTPTEENNKLSRDVSKLKTDLDAANEEIDYYKNALKLYDAESMAASGQYEAAADILVLLKDVQFKDNEKVKFDSTYADIMGKASQLAYNRGFSLVNQNKYQEAVTEFSKIQTYANDFRYMDVVLYNIGKCYTALNDARSAVDAYQKLQASYPKSKYAAWAGYRINELTAVP